MKYILIAILCIGLHSTNPSKTDFIEFASMQIKKKYPELDFKPESSATSLEKLISGFGNTMVSNFLTVGEVYWQTVRNRSFDDTHQIHFEVKSAKIA